MFASTDNFSLESSSKESLILYLWRIQLFKPKQTGHVLDSAYK